MNILKIIVTTLIIFISFLVVFLKPKMHKKIRIENADFDVVQFSEKKIEKKAPPFYAPKRKATAPQAQPEEQPQPIEQVAPSNYQETPHVAVPQAPVAAPQISQPPKQQAAPVVKKQLTAEQEEIIAWNKWRSDLQNQTMRDSRIAAPVGTRFNFSFTVDKFGNISNLRIWAEPSVYTGIGIRAVRPVLLKYQGQPILNFPPKSNRVVVNVEGHFFTSRSSTYSSPSDYSDYERVK